MLGFVLVALLFSCVAGQQVPQVANNASQEESDAAPNATSGLPTNVQQLLDSILEDAGPADVPDTYSGRFAFASEADQALLPAALQQLAADEQPAASNATAGAMQLRDLQPATDAPLAAGGGLSNSTADADTNGAGDDWVQAFLADSLLLHSCTNGGDASVESDEGAAGGQDDSMPPEDVLPAAGARRLLGERRSILQQQQQQQQQQQRAAAAQPQPYRWQEPATQLKRRIVGVTVVFENSARYPRYGYAENLGDGRGITFGRCGFCTGTGDGVQVINLYARYRPRSKLASYLPALRAIMAQGGGGNVKGLDGFSAAVRAAANDGAFRYAQDVLHETLYYRPAMALARAIGVKWGITKGEIYDAFIQHGWSDNLEKDSVGGITRSATVATGGRPFTKDEWVWLSNFLAARRAILGGDKKWLDAVYRVDFYKNFLTKGNLPLNGPLTIWGIRVP